MALLILAAMVGWAFGSADMLPAPATEVFETEKSPFLTEFNRSNGLPVAEVNKLFRDQQGLLWLMSPEGLVRYDGMAFRLFKFNPGDSNSLADNWVDGMTETPDGHLWIATGKGISIMEPGGSKIRTLQLPDTFQKDLHHRAITAIYYDPVTHHIFFGFHNGVGQVALNGEFRGVYNIFGKDRNYHKVTQICRDSAGRLWISALQFGLYRIHEKEKRVTRYHVLDAITSKPIFIQPVSVSEPVRGRFYIHTWGQGILKVSMKNPDTLLVKSLIWDKEPGIAFWSNIATGVLMKPDPSGRVAFFSSMDAGFGTLDLQTDQINIIHVRGKKGILLDPVHCSDVLFANGSIWIANSSGLWQYCPDNQFLEKYRIPQDNQSYWGVQEPFVPADVASDPLISGVYWMVSEKGVVARWDRRKSEIRYHYQPFLKRRRHFLATRRIFILPSHFLLITDRGNFLQNRKTMEMEQNHPYKFFDTLSVSDIIEKADSAWVVTTHQQGVFMFNPLNKSGYRIHPHEKVLGSLRHAVPFGDQLLLTGTAGAFKIIDTRTGKNQVPSALTIRHSTDTLNGLYRPAIQSSNEFWMASPYGLFLYRQQDSYLTSWTNPVYGSNHWIHDVVCDQYRNVWYLGRSFLGFISHDKKVQYTFDHTNGLEQEPFQSMQLCRDSTLIVLSRNACYVKPANARQPGFARPVIRLESVEMDGKQLRGNLGSHIDVPATVKSLELSFLNLRFGGAGQYVFRVEVQARRGEPLKFFSSKIRLSFLKPGEYKVTAVVYDKNNLWNSDRTEMVLNVKPPWYSSLWAILLFSMFLALLVTIIVKLLIRRKDRQNEEKRRVEKTLADLEMSTLRAQINPHFIFNSLNSIQHYILANRALDASDYLAKFSRLIRLVLESSVENVISLEQEKELLIYYLELEKLRTNHKFTYSIYIDPALSSHVKIPSMLAQPYLENSIWHGFDGIAYPGRIEVMFLRHAGFCLCKIKDNGKGMQAAVPLTERDTKHKPRGTAITRMRLELISPDAAKAVEYVILRNENGEVNGTEVRIKIPIHED